MATWLPVVGYESLYEVSSEGAVRSRPRKGTRGGLLVLMTNKNTPYPFVNLCANGVCKLTRVHGIVARAFHGPCPPGLEVRHLDGQPTNNAAANLQYGTASENNYDRVLHGTHPQAAKTRCKRGHEFTVENTRRGSRGHRECRVCSRMHQRNYDARRRAAPTQVA